MLQGPTPQSANRNSIVGPPASPSPSYVSNAGSSHVVPPPPSPAISIQIPQVGDMAMQRFFHDIVDQLHSMSMRTSPPMASPATFGSPVFATPALPAHVQQSPHGIWQDPTEDATQFDDAEDDASIAGSYTPMSVPPSPILGGPPVQPLSIRSRAVPAFAPGPAPLRQRNSVQATTPPMLAPRPPLRPHSTTAASGRSVSPGGYDKENRGGPRAQAGGAGKATLGLAILPDGMPSSLPMSPTPSTGTTKSKSSSKRGSASPGLATPVSPLFSDFGSPNPNEKSAATKGSWFQSIFSSWKPQTVRVRIVNRR